MKLTAAGIAIFLIAGPVAVADDLETVYQSLREAEGKKDAAQVKKLAADTCALARKEEAAPAPSSDAEKEAWKQRVDYAKDAELFSEYALYSVAIQSQPAAMVDLIGALEQQNPKSKYLSDAYGSYIYALSQSGGSAKIPAVAEKALANFPANEDLLLVMANSTFSKKQNDRALGYADRLVAVLGKKPKPDGVSAADWERKKTAGLGRGYWIAGVVRESKNQHVDADRDLRASLPLIKGDQMMTSYALFNLGLANYQLGTMTLNKSKVLEGAKFSEQCAAIDGPLHEQAYRNALLMKDAAGKMR
jgi:hypothetical protein